MVSDIPARLKRHPVFDIKYRRVGDRYTWCLPVAFESLSDSGSTNVRPSDVDGNGICDAEDWISSPAIYVAPASASYPNTASLQLAIHLMSKQFMYQETFGTNTWDLWTDAEHAHDDNMVLNSCVLFKRLSDVVLSVNYTQGSLLIGELDKWLMEARSEETDRFMFIDICKLSRFFAPTLGHERGHRDPAPKEYIGRWML